jgi:DNA (cytosine-5)-methyltransferase 1
MTLTVGSLFSGIGGLDLGLERAGMNVIWQSEIDPYASQVLAKHWPEVPNHGDIKLIRWGDLERPDVICGGYPCQPFSLAGSRAGDDDPRHLWPWVRDAISHLRPRYAVLENVRGHLTLGGTTVVGDLASIGYDAEWQLVRASAVGASHRRERVFIVAYSAGQHDKNAAFSELSTEPSLEPGGGSWPHIPGPPWETDFRGMGRVADGVPARVDRLRGLGNAVVPQVAEVIGRLVVEHATHN